MKNLLDKTKLFLMLGALGILALGALSTPSIAGSDLDDAVAAPCPKSSSASCAYDPDTNWSYRDAASAYLN